MVLSFILKRIKTKKEIKYLECLVIIFNDMKGSSFNMIF